MWQVGSGAGRPLGNRTLIPSVANAVRVHAPRGNARRGNRNDHPSCARDFILALVQTLARGEPVLVGMATLRPGRQQQSASMVATQTRSATDLLVEWANRQDGWIRAIVGEALLSRREASAEVLDRVTQSFLTEKQLAQGEQIPAPVLGQTLASEDAEQTMTLLSLRDCHDVNALAEGQSIEFNPRMTVLFGKNATGKTGYVRVFKRVANVRSAEQIIPDIHRATAAGSPKAMLRYAVDGHERELAWQGETGVSPLTRLSVFDSPAVALHLEDNLTYVYTPPELALFRYVHTAIDGVRARLEEQRAAREPRQNPFLTAFRRDNPIYPKVEQLGSATDLPELERLATVTETERAELESLKISIEALSGQNMKGHVQMLRTRIALLRALEVVASAAGEFDAQRLATAEAELRAAVDAQEAAASAVFGGDHLPAALRPAWQSFVETGERYLNASGLEAYPRSDDDCIYCRQPLDGPALDLIRSYREHAQGTVVAAVDSARATVRAARQPLLRPELDAALANLRTALPDIEETNDPPAWAVEGRQLVEAVDQARAHVSRDQTPAVQPPTVSVPPTLREQVTSALAEAQTTLSGVEGDARDREALLKEQRARLETLEARLALARLIPEIRTYVESAAWASRLSLLLARFQGILRGLTELSKTASDEVLNQNFQRAFDEECRALRAPAVTLGFPGRKGQAARRKSVATDHALTAVLSEGEQKVIAVADFLAETSFRGGSAPVVFDDPVTSLDHERIHEMVRRIVALSEKHQVVVFTHDIWFASELLAEFEDREEDCSFFHVTERSGAKGIITGGIHPRVDTQARIRKRINSGIQDARAAGDEDRTDVVEQTYDHVRAWIEVVVERDLLASVTRRYQPNVAMQNLDRIKADRLRDAIDVILPVFERACRYIPGHSQPIETLGVRPTIEELEEDWRHLQEARKQYTG